ncbi:hypothetical protein WJX72_000602 [[Myrmecia] bisecta]|uniref:N-acetyltransferase domain-containing protein n=1 Tax=[Myrmecia] bisecta TaxID=41462 RepID=A0AAW1Q6E3_9CHLO
METLLRADCICVRSCGDSSSLRPRSPLRLKFYIVSRLQHRDKQRRRPHEVSCHAESAGFHQSRMVAETRANKYPPLDVSVRHAEQDPELQAAALLRAQTFYVYPPERKFAGELHQLVMAENEFQLLRQQQLDDRLSSSNQKFVCIIAVCAAASLPDIEAGLLVDGAEGKEAVVGSMDLWATRALPDEYLRGSRQNPAYIANMCVAAEARRRQVGGVMLEAARSTARAWGVGAMYVHTMAVNEAARQFYAAAGFVVEKEESSNEAHYRGHCLDGVEGRGRTVLLRDATL